MTYINKFFDRIKENPFNCLIIIILISLITFIINISLNTFLKQKNKNIWLENQKEDYPFEVFSYVDFDGEEIPKDVLNSFSNINIKKMQKKYKKDLKIGVADSVIYFGANNDSEIYFINDDFLDIFLLEHGNKNFDDNKTVYIGSNIKELINKEEKFVTDFQGLDKDFPLTKIIGEKITIVQNDTKTVVDYEIINSEFGESFIKAFIYSNLYSKEEMKQVDKEKLFNEKVANINNMVIMPMDYFKANIYSDSKDKKIHIDFINKYNQEEDLEKVINIVKEFRNTNDYYKYEFIDINLKNQEQSNDNNIFLLIISLIISLIGILTFGNIGKLSLNLYSRKKDYSNLFFEGKKSIVIKEMFAENIITIIIGFSIGIILSFVFVKQYENTIYNILINQEFLRLNIFSSLLSFLLILFSGLISWVFFKNQIINKNPVEYVHSKKYDN